MSARSESWSRRAEAARAALAAAFAVVLLAAGWALLHTELYSAERIVDTPLYERYAEATLAGGIPYRDFELEYPPGALPAFVAPALVGGDYETAFDLLMLAFGAAAVVFVAVALVAVGASPPRLYAAVAFVAVAPLALGSVVLSRYDLWPAALTAAALAAFTAGRERLGFGALALAVAAKLYPVVLAPLALLYVARRSGARGAVIGLAVFASVLAVAFVPFALVAPDGLAASFERQMGRPLQIESLGAAILLTAHLLDGGYVPSVVSSHGSQNLAGPVADSLGAVHVALQLVAVVAVSLLFARGDRSRESLLAASAASVVALVALGKVLSPQFALWLVPLVPLVAGAAGLVAGVLLAAALLLTQLWFPSRYWELVALEAGPATLVLARDLVLVALFVVLALAIRRGREAPRNA